MISQMFGERLKQLREEKGISASALAFAVGVTEGAIRQMESGQTKSASFPVGIRIARKLGVSPYYLAGENEPNGTKNALPSEIGDDRVTKLERQLEILSHLPDQVAALAHQLAALAEQMKSPQHSTRSAKRKHGSS